MLEEGEEEAVAVKQLVESCMLDDVDAAEDRLDAAVSTCRPRYPFRYIGG